MELGLPHQPPLLGLGSTPRATGRRRSPDARAGSATYEHHRFRRMASLADAAAPRPILCRLDRSSFVGASDGVPAIICRGFNASAAARIALFPIGFCVALWSCASFPRFDLRKWPHPAKHEMRPSLEGVPGAESRPKPLRPSSGLILSNPSKRHDVAAGDTIDLRGERLEGSLLLGMVGVPIVDPAHAAHRMAETALGVVVRHLDPR